MRLRWRFAYYLSVRLAAESVAARIRHRAQHSKSENRVDGVMLALWALSLPALATYVGLITWWLLTGQGPGGKVIAVEQRWIPFNPDLALRRLN